MKILIIALSGIGDALMFSPALSLLRKKYPDAQIDLLAMFKGVEELYRNNEDVTSVHFVDFMKGSPFASLASLYRFRREKYDVSITVYPANRWPYNIISYLIAARTRLGHEYNHANLRSLNFLNTIRVREDDNLHNVEENLRLVSHAGVSETDEVPGLGVVVGQDAKRGATDWLASQGVSQDALVIGFHAGSSLLKNHARRRWAPEKFAELGKTLFDRHGAKVLLFGGPEEYELNDAINRMMGGNAVVVKVPSLMIGVGIMKRCRVFVVNDSGLMHVAAGLKLPIVTIFAYTNPKYVYPWKTDYIMVRHELECSPCFYYSPRPARCIWHEDAFRCITHIQVNEVFSAVRTMLEKPVPVSSKSI
jgi:heptosyltransferase-2